ncbi:FemAB family XrtA/PEP-CTERM system-associated protein [Gemmatimonadota bacterium]
MNESRIERFDDEDSWNAFVRSQDGWTHFHLFEWKQVIEKVFGHECIYLTQLNADQGIEGVLPLVRVKSRLFGHFLVSMPFVNYGGPLGSTGAVQGLTKHAAELAGENGADLLELRCRGDLGLELPVSNRKITVLLDLPPNDPDLLWKSLKAKVRSQVRRPQKEGVEVRFGRDQIDPFYDVFCRHMRDLGTPTLPLSLFETIAEKFTNDVWCACAYLNGAPIAAGLGFRWDNEFEMTWASALQAFNRIAPNMLLYWSFLERAINEGVTLFNFGRCTPGGGTHRFKLQWGSREEPLWWYQVQKNEVTTGTPSPDDAKYAWGPRIWKRLPLPVANCVGPRVVRYIP